MKFAYFDLLYWGAALSVATCWWLWRLHQARLKRRDLYGERHVLDRHTRPLTVRWAIINAVCWAGIVFLAMGALAWPVSPDHPDSVRKGTMEAVGVYDVSWSSDGEDYRGKMPNCPPGTTVATGRCGSRLLMARFLTEQIMKVIAGNNLGLVTYMGDGFRIFPTFTDDFTGLKFTMEQSLFSGNAPGGGSDITQGLLKAVELIESEGDKSKQHVIVLFSDGGFDGKQEDLDKVLHYIREKGYRLVVIGLGGNNEVDLPMYDSTTGAFVKYRPLDDAACPKDEQGQPTHCNSTAIDEDVLKMVAATAGGEYHVVPPGQTSVQVNWATALGGSVSQPEGAPMFQYCIAGIAVLLFIISLPGFSRRRDVV
jgi:von Willebrand factor type A domain